MMPNIFSLLKPKQILRASNLISRASRACALSLAAVAAAACASRTQEPSPSATPSITPLPVAELLRRADEQYAGRADLGQVREGLKTIRRIRAVEHDNYEAAWRAARLDYVLGDGTSDGNEKEQAFTDGMEAGETATRVAPERVEGHFWLGANYGAYAEFKGVIYGATYTDKLRREMEAAIKIDPGFEAGSAYYALGQLDRELPEMLGGDPERAVKTLEEGLKYGANNALLHLELAQAYLATHRKDDARRELTWVVNSKPDPNYLPEHEEAVKTARDLLAKNF